MNGGQVVDLTVEILKEIRDSTRAGFERTNAALVEVRGELSELRSSVDKLNDRFDHFLEFAGDRYRTQETRIARLEDRVFGTGGSGP